MTRKLSSAGRSSSPVASSTQRPTSIGRSRPDRATRTAAGMSSRGSKRLRANRFPVPAASTPRGTPLPARVAPTTRTVPSPPSAQTTSASAWIAARVWPSPGSSGVVSHQTGSAQPASSQISATRRFVAARSVTLVGLTTTAIRGRSSVSSANGSRVSW